jgi:hypothetical protein
MKARPSHNKNTLATLGITTLMLLLISYACTQTTKEAPWNHLSLKPQSKHLLDSVLKLVQSQTFKKDTSIGFDESNNKLTPLLVQIHHFDSLDYALGNISFNESDSSDVQIFLFKVIDSDWIFLKKISYTNPNWLTLGISLELKDLDFDHQNDLLIKIHSGSASRVLLDYMCYEFDSKNGSIGRLKIDDLTSTDVVDCDAKLKTITCYTDGGNYGTHEKRIYVWDKDSLKLIKQFNKYHEPIDFNKIEIDSEQIEDYPEFTIREDEYLVREGKMILVKSIDVSDSNTTLTGY